MSGHLKKNVDWLISLGTVAAILLFAFLLTDMRYILNDDAILGRTLAGCEGGVAETFNPYTHAVFTWLIHALTLLFPAVMWYSVAQLFLLALGLYVLARSILRAARGAGLGRLAGWALGAAFLAVFALEFSSAITYTQTVAILGAASVWRLLSVDACAGAPQVRRGVLCSAGVLLAGYLLRPVAAAPAACFWALALVIRLLWGRAEGKGEERLSQAMVAGCGGVAPGAAHAECDKITLRTAMPLRPATSASGALPLKPATSASGGVALRSAHAKYDGVALRSATSANDGMSPRPATSASGALPLKPALTACAVALALLLLLTGAGILDARFSGEEDYIRWQEARTEATDYGGLARATANTLEAAGWTERDYAMAANHWFFMDASMSAEKLQTVCGAPGDALSLPARLKDAARLVVSALRRYSNLLCFALLVAGLCLLGWLRALLAPKKRLWALLAPPTCVLTSAVLLMYLALQGRLPMRAAATVLLPAGALAAWLALVGAGGRKDAVRGSESGRSGAVSGVISPNGTDIGTAGEIPLTGVNVETAEICMSSGAGIEATGATVGASLLTGVVAATAVATAGATPPTGATAAPTVPAPRVHPLARLLVLAVAIACALVALWGTAVALGRVWDPARKSPAQSVYARLDEYAVAHPELLLIGDNALDIDRRLFPDWRAGKPETLLPIWGCWNNHSPAYRALLARFGFDHNAFGAADFLSANVRLVSSLPQPPEDFMAWLAERAGGAIAVETEHAGDGFTVFRLTRAGAE